MKTRAPRGRSRGWLLRASLGACMVLCIPARASATPAPNDAPAAGATLHGHGGTIDDRVALITKTLGLDTAQQSKLRKILAGQREAVRKIWNDPTLLPAERAPATLAANERSADEIRAILTAEQKNIYNPPKSAAVPEAGNRRSVEEWLNASHAPAGR